jgi:hypothetical protein
MHGRCKKIAYKIFVGKPEADRALGRPVCAWEDNSRRDVRKVGGEGMDWMHLAQGRDRWWDLVNTVMTLPIS